jgi:hypothetical protein
MIAGPGLAPAHGDQLQHFGIGAVPEPEPTRSRNDARIGPRANVAFGRRDAVQVARPWQGRLVGERANDAPYRAERRRTWPDGFACEARTEVGTGADESARHAGSSPVSAQASSSWRVTSPTGPCSASARTPSTTAGGRGTTRATPVNVARAAATLDGTAVVLGTGDRCRACEAARSESYRRVTSLEADLLASRSTRTTPAAPRPRSYAKGPRYALRPT